MRDATYQKKLEKLSFTAKGKGQQTIIKKKSSCVSFFSALRAELLFIYLATYRT